MFFLSLLQKKKEMEKFAKSDSIKLTKRLFVPAETGKKSEVVEGVGLSPCT